MIDQTLHDKIEAYLLGDLSPEEAAAFEKQIGNDPELAEEVELHRLILPVPGRLAELDLQQDFARWRQELETDPPPGPSPDPKPGSGKIWFALIALLPLAGAFWLWQHYEPQLTLERAERRRLEQALEAEKLKSDTREQEIRQLREDLFRLQQTAPAPAIKPATLPGGKQQVAVTQPPAPDPEWTQLADQELIAYADVMLESLRDRGAAPGEAGGELVRQADTAIVNKQYRKALNLLTRVKADDQTNYPKALEMLAYVYFKRKQYAQAVDAYLKYREFDKDTDKTDWDLCLFYLADYPRYKADFQKLLKAITGDDKHPRRTDALMLRDELAKKGVWLK